MKVSVLAWPVASDGGSVSLRRGTSMMSVRGGSLGGEVG